MKHPRQDLSDPMNRVALARAALSSVLAAFYVGCALSERQWWRVGGVGLVLVLALWDFCRRIIPPVERS
ncbi:hypothetical protein [Oleiharenicola sp. Vm1]|uniref:hypothetical protein n=1 Tax=Oleiharenicola sp. Vm1 TaxID=3398393 RepID=UPI0039F5DB56